MEGNNEHSHLPTEETVDDAEIQRAKPRSHGLNNEAGLDLIGSPLFNTRGSSFWGL